MSEFKSYSQSGQDRFAFEVLGRKTDGTFLDIGSGHVTEKSNSYGLEQIGWRGLCVDLNPQGDVKERKCLIFAMDATKVNWIDFLFTQGFWSNIDYLSLDVDSASLLVLRSLPFEILRFKVLTVEHDSYRFGNAPRDEMRRFISSFGYKLICADVEDLGFAYEDWWVAPSEMKNAERFLCS